MKQQPIIGLEVHVELATKSKMFCGCSAEHFGVQPNTHTCPVCLGLPGALPVPNEKAVEWTVLLALALGCRINRVSKFDRKNYFYPDLPKGYQITQYDQPFGEGGSLGKIRIRRVHLEEDTGKLQHTEVDGEKVALVDFNRSGVPLVEIVTEPGFRSIEEVDQYLKALQKIIRYLGISSADMEKGSMRLEPSISLSADGELPAYRVELKNINSFRFVRRALEYEIERQQREPHVQQTRGWNESKGETVPQREKEEAHDYRYFPEPDIPPIKLTESYINEQREKIPELPQEKATRFVKEFKLSEYDALQLTDDKSEADFFEEAVKIDTTISPKHIANWIINRKNEIENLVPAQLLVKIKQSQQASEVNPGQLEEVVKRVIQENPKAVEDYKKNGNQVVGFLVGQVRRQIQVNPKVIAEKILIRLKS